MKALDAFVLCSRNEGFGRVVVEALAANAPVVVSREGALPELSAESPERGSLVRLSRRSSPSQYLSSAPVTGEFLETTVATFAVSPISTRVLNAYRDCRNPGSGVRWRSLNP